MQNINLKIITPERIVLEETIEQITLPTAAGEITILPNHIPIVSLLKPGEIRIKANKEEKILACSGGFIEFNNNQLKILADSAEHLEELDELKIKEAQERALQLIKEKQQTDVDFSTLQAHLEREMARLKVLEKYRSSRRHGLSPSQPNRPEVEIENLSAKHSS